MIVNGTPVVSESNLQNTVADSSCYAESLALHRAVREVMNMHNFFERLNIKLMHPTIDLKDN